MEVIGRRGNAGEGRNRNFETFYSKYFFFGSIFFHRGKLIVQHRNHETVGKPCRPVS